MTWVGALLNAGTGSAYIAGVGVFSFLLARKAWSMGDHRLAMVFYGLVGMASSCGPHHLHLAEHFALSIDRPTTPDLVAITVALPFGAAWLWWQAPVVMRRARWSPDWRIDGSKDWPLLMLAALIAYVTLVVRSAAHGLPAHHVEAGIQLTLLVLYCVIGYLLWTGQLRFRRITGTWSAKGLALAVIFPTCAAEHACYGLAVAAGRYASDVHPIGEAWIDSWGILVAVFFVVVTVRERHAHRLVVPT